MVQRRKLDLSQKDPEKSVFEYLLDTWGIGYEAFAELIGIDHRSLWRYRKGQRSAKFDTSQIKEIEKLLRRVGLTFRDLPDDWLLDKSVQPSTNKVAETPAKYVLEVKKEVLADNS